MAERYPPRRRLRRNWPRGGTTGRQRASAYMGGRARKRLIFTARSSLGRGRGYLRRVGFYSGGGSGCTGKAELKFFDQDIDDANVDAGGTIFLNGSTEASLVRFAQGDGESNRDGRKVCIKKIQWRYQLTQAAAAAATVTSQDTVRVILYLDKQANGAAATVLDILETADFQAFNQLANSQRFYIYMDRTHDMGPCAAAGDGAANDSGAVEQSYTFYKKVAIPIEYNNASTDGALATVRSNNLNVLLISKASLTTFASKMRLRFIG